MPIFKPFKGYRPVASEAKKFASLPFDCVSASDVASASESQFLKVTRPDLFSENSQDDIYALSQKALMQLIESGQFLQDKQESFYLYGLTADAKSYYGIIGCLSVDDYKSGTLVQHELTRRVKVEDRKEHILKTGFHTEPVLGAIRYNLDVDLIINDCLFLDPEFDFVTSDGVTHQFWTITNPSKIKRLQSVFANEINSVYIADGHHRCAASVAAFDSLKSIGNDSAESHCFLAAVFPMHQLLNKPYHRLITVGVDRAKGFVAEISQFFDLVLVTDPFYPKELSQLGMLVDSLWYQLTYKTPTIVTNPATTFNEAIISELLKIASVQDADNIMYVGKPEDIQSVLANKSELEGQVFFTLPALPAQKIFDLSDAGAQFPPKSTWFEPKPRCGLVIHSLDI